MAEHPLGRRLVDAANGTFPAADLAVEVVGPPPGQADAVVAFSGHNLIAAPVDPGEVRTHLPDDDPGGPMSAPFLAWLGTHLGSAPGSLDVVLVAAGTGGGGAGLARRDDADATGRVARARVHRSEVVVHADLEGNGIVILGRGLAGRLEVSIEVPEAHRARGIGTRLARAALGLVPPDELVFAQVAPGNVASLRAFLAAGYRPICSEVLFLRPR
jgi:GNAT superfamily N-acetyltransferase